MSQNVLPIEACPYEDRAVSQNCRSEGSIGHRDSRFSSRFALILLSIVSCAMTAALFDFARAEDCLAAPNSPAPKGSHWYYHLNRATQGKCWYVRPIERLSQSASIQTTSANAGRPSTNADQSGSTGSRDVDSAASQSKPVIAATEESALGALPSAQVPAAVPEPHLSDADPRPKTPTTVVWPDPPPIPPLLKSEDAEAATASRDRIYSVADTSHGVSRKDGRTGTFDIPITIFPALAFGLVVFGFALRFLMRRAAAGRGQEIDYIERVAASTNDSARPTENELLDEPVKLGKGDFESFVSAASGDGPLERIIVSVHSENDVAAREARLARLREDIGQHLGWVEPEQRHPSRQKLAS